MMINICVDRLAIRVNILMLLVSILMTPLTHAQVSSSQYELIGSIVDGGGGQSSGEQFIVSGTIGQANIDNGSGGNYELLVGFWPGGPLCVVDLRQFAAFAQHWLESDCDSDNGWCGGADLNHLNGVDFADLEMFAQQWLFSCPYRWSWR